MDVKDLFKRNETPTFVWDNEKPKQIFEMQSTGTIDDYLSGKEEFKLDRKSTKGSNMVGAVELLVDGNDHRVFFYKVDTDLVVTFFEYNGEQVKGSGRYSKEAFFDLLNKLKAKMNKKESIREMQSTGTIEDYLSGREPFKMDRKAKQGTNISGVAELIIDGEHHKVTVYKHDIKYYSARFVSDKSPIVTGEGRTAKKAFFNMLKNLKARKGK